MSNSEVLYYVIFGAALIFGLIFFIADRGTLHMRMKSDLKSQGYRVLSIKQKVVGMGWLTYKSPYIFTVRYLDRQGNEHQTHCEPNLLWGNAWSNDIIVNDAEQKRINRLMQTKKRLEAELQHLEQQHKFEIETLQRHKDSLQAKLINL